METPSEVNREKQYARAKVALKVIIIGFVMLPPSFAESIEYRARN